MPRPCVVTIAAIDGEHRDRRERHDVAGDRQDDVATAPRCPATSSFALSPSAAQATPKNSENTTICRISLVAIASTTSAARDAPTNSFSDSDATLRLVEALGVGQRQVEVVARPQDVDQDHAEQQRYQRGADEPEHRLAADAADRLGVAHVRDADHQGREHQRRDDHLDQPQEDVGERARCSRRSSWRSSDRATGCCRRTRPGCRAPCR